MSEPWDRHWGRRVWVKIQDGSTRDSQGNTGFRLKVAYWASIPQGFSPYDPFDPINGSKLPRPQQAEDFDDLQLDPNSSDYYEKRLIDPTTNQSVSALRSLSEGRQVLRESRITRRQKAFFSIKMAKTTRALSAKTILRGI